MYHIPREKLSRMKNIIADKDGDISRLAESYTGLEIDPKNFFKNQARTTMFYTMQYFSKLKEPIDYKNPLNRMESFSNAYLNAFYYNLQNLMVLPAVSLGDRMFDSDRPMYTNYGTIGFVIGHEITHGFDNDGRLFNSEGNYVQGWWEPETVAKLS